MTAVHEPIERLAERTARAFETHADRFAAITDGARGRFEKRMWREQTAAVAQRAALRDRAIAAAAREIRVHDGFERSWALPWDDLCREAVRQVAGVHRHAWAAGFSACVAHRLGEQSVWTEDIPHVEAGPGDLAGRVGVRVLDGPLEAVARRALEGLEFRTRWADFDGDVARVATAWQAIPANRPEVLVHVEPLFRGRCAWVLALLRGSGCVVPSAVRLAPVDDGIAVAEILQDPDELARVFDDTHLPVMVPSLDPTLTVDFLCAVAPGLSRESAFHAIGLSEISDELARRRVARQLAATGARLGSAPGVRGAATIVLAAPGLDVVLKVVRDRFPAPNVCSRDDLLACFRGIGTRRRAGRVPDARELEHLVLPHDAFEVDVLHELASSARSEFEVLSGGKVSLRHAFAQRRLRPLASVFREVDPDQITVAARELGHALRELARAGWFPGDTTANSFGLAPDGTVLLSDPGRLWPLSACRFVELPRAEERFAAGANDVFPERLVRDLIPSERGREEFFREHAELARPEFWSALAAESEV